MGWQVGNGKANPMKCFQYLPRKHLTLGNSPLLRYILKQQQNNNLCFRYLPKKHLTFSPSYSLNSAFTSLKEGEFVFLQYFSLHLIRSKESHVSDTLNANGIAMQLYFIQCLFPNQIQFDLANNCVNFQGKRIQN